jgi:SAM-dependent methyltransferase
MDSTVSNFFTKNPDQAYIDQYDIDHGPRLDAMIQKWELRSLKNQKIVDVGGGLGFLGKRLDPSNDYWIIDGANVPQDKRLCKGSWHTTDLDFTQFGSDVNWSETYPSGSSGSSFMMYPAPKNFDAAFCLETLEHLSNPYNCLVEIKKLVKRDGFIYLSIPHVNVTHNYIYPALMIDPNWFSQWLEQLALPVVEYWLWDKGWNAHHFKCRNADWIEAKMLFPKHEEKFRGKTPIEYVNL